MRLSFAWWNSSLSPLGKSRATNEQKSIALAVVRYLTEEVKVDCLALGEVTYDDLIAFKSELELQDYEIIDGTLKKERLNFDTGVIYRKSSLYFVSQESITINRSNHHLKLANKLKFLMPFCDSPLYLFVSHWPSRLWCQVNGADRHVLGLRLHDEIDSLHKIHGVPANVILLGDYNDEPHDSSLESHLLAVRDRRLVRKNKNLLYNPFWRHLGEPLPHQPGKPCPSFSGSCCLKSSTAVETKWRTFDQIIFSAAFIGQSAWQLNEDYTQILRGTSFDLIVSARNQIFDHFPVISVIERKDNDG